MLLFNASTHTYLLREPDGVERVIPSVTQILCPGGPPAFVAREKLDYGTLVHSEISQSVKMDARAQYSLDCTTPHAFQALKCLRELKARIVNSEFIVFHREMSFAGMVDLEIRVNSAAWILDFKVNSVPSHAGAQLAAYRQAINSVPRRLPVTRRAVVLLLEDTFKFIDCDAQPNNDWGVFRDALAAYQERKLLEALNG